MLAALCVLLAWRLRLTEVRADQTPITDQGQDVAPAPDYAPDWGRDIHDPQGSDIQAPQNSDIIYPDPDPGPAPPVTEDTEQCQCRSMRRCVDCVDLRPCPGENR